MGAVVALGGARCLLGAHRGKGELGSGEQLLFQVISTLLFLVPVCQAPGFPGGPHVPSCLSSSTPAPVLCSSILPRPLAKAWSLFLVFPLSLVLSDPPLGPGSPVSAPCPAVDLWVPARGGGHTGPFDTNTPYSSHLGPKRKTQQCNLPGRIRCVPASVCRNRNLSPCPTCWLHT